MQAALKQIVNDPRFERTIVMLIVVNAVVLGMETYPDLESRFGEAMLWINYIISFVIVATFVVINLFIAVVINNLEAAKMERRIQASPASGAIALEIQAVREALTRLEARVDEGGSQR